MSESTPPPGQYPASQPLSPDDQKLWSTLVHIGGIFFYFLPALIGYLVLKDRGPFVRQHTTTALNFQITIALASIVGGITIVLLIGFLILAAAAIVNLVFSVIAAVTANRGEYYEYPLAIKFIK
jgi:uncharacterized protein